MAAVTQAAEADKMAAAGTGSRALERFKKAGSSSRRQESIEKWVNSITPEGESDGQPKLDAPPATVPGLDDDLSLGAEARLLQRVPERPPATHTQPELTPGARTTPPHRVADSSGGSPQAAAPSLSTSSAYSREMTWRTKLALMGLIRLDSIKSDVENKKYETIDEVLQDRATDPEVVLTNLGFGAQAGMAASSRVPERFLTKKSRAIGISVQSYLDNNPELRDYMESRGVTMADETAAIPGNSGRAGRHQRVTGLAEVWLGCNISSLADLAMYLSQCSVPGHYLASLEKVYPCQPLSTADVRADEISMEDEVLLKIAESSPCRLQDDNCRMLTGDDLTNSHLDPNNNTSPVAEIPFLDNADLSIDQSDSQQRTSPHVLAAQQAELSIMKARIQSSRKRPAENNQPTRSEAGSDGQSGQGEWDYSDVSPTNKDGFHRKSTSLPQIESYVYEEMFMDTSQLPPRSETIDFYIYDDEEDDPGKRLTSQGFLTFDPTYFYHHAVLAPNESLV